MKKASTFRLFILFLFVITICLMAMLTWIAF